MDYYSIVAGLPDIEIEDKKLAFSLVDFREEVYPQLSFNDARLINLFYMKFDNQNLLNYLRKKDVQFDVRGNLTKEDMEEGFDIIFEHADPTTMRIPPYFNDFVEEYKGAQWHDDENEEANWENRLTELYYQWAMKCGNKLIASWFEYNLNLNNILSAYAYRKYQMDLEVVGGNEEAETIKTSGQRDFGLAGSIDELNVFLNIADEPELFEREMKIDLMRWQWLEEQTFFHYFSIEKIFAYLVKLEIIERWMNFNHEQGEKIFRKLIDGLKESVVNKK